MFTTQVQTVSPVKSAARAYGLQFVAAIFLGYAAHVPLTLTFLLLGFDGEHGRPPHFEEPYFAGYDHVALAIVSLGIGYAAAKLLPALQPTGLWIWILPAIMAGPEFRRSPDSCIPFLPGWLYSSGGFGPLGAPIAISTIGYSIGMALFRYGQPKWRNHVQSPRSRRAVAASIAIILAGLTAISLRMFRAADEYHWDRWSRVRTIPYDQAVAVFDNNSDACLDAKPSEILKGGAWVRVLQTVTCDATTRTVERVCIFRSLPERQSGWIVSSSAGGGLRQPSR